MGLTAAALFYYQAVAGLQPGSGQTVEEGKDAGGSQPSGSASHYMSAGSLAAQALEPLEVP